MNGTRAAIRAGYSAKTARGIASETLKKPQVAAEVARRKNARRQQFEGDAERLIQALRRIAMADISGIFDKHGGIKNPDHWPAEAWDGIQSVKYSEKLTPDRDGKMQRVSYRVAIRKKDALKALDALARYWGLTLKGPSSTDRRDRVIVASG